MQLSPEMMGFTVGLIIGLLDFMALTFVKKRLDARAPDHNASPGEQRRIGSLLNLAALGSLIMFPLIGYFAGPYVFSPGLTGGGG